MTTVAVMIDPRGRIFVGPIADPKGLKPSSNIDAAFAEARDILAGAEDQVEADMQTGFDNVRPEGEDELRAKTMGAL